MVSSTDLDIINVYRSSSSVFSGIFIKDLLDNFDDTKMTVVTGDLNICYISENSHPIIRKLEAMKFKQSVKLPTHKQGRQIDHVFFYSPQFNECPKMDVLQFGQFFTDHDMLVGNLSIESPDAF